MSDLKKNFVSESDLEARKQKRQEEWEKVRKPEDPKEAPEEEYDCRSLYDRLKEQKDKQQAEYEETHKLKNMIRGLDDGEVEFLDLVDRTKVEIEAQRWKEEFHELRDFHKAVATLNEESNEQKLQARKKIATEHLLSSKPPKKTQQSLLATAIKRKNSSNSAASVRKIPKTEGAASNDNPMRNEASSNNNSTTENNEVVSIQPVHCIGVLPGLGVYSDSSDSDDSELEDRTKFDLLGRPQLQQEYD